MQRCEAAGGMSRRAVMLWVDAWVAMVHRSQRTPHVRAVNAQTQRQGPQLDSTPAAVVHDLWCSALAPNLNSWIAVSKMRTLKLLGRRDPGAPKAFVLMLTLSFALVAILQVPLYEPTVQVLRHCGTPRARPPRYYHRDRSGTIRSREEVEPGVWDPLSHTA